MYQYKISNDLTSKAKTAFSLDNDKSVENFVNDLKNINSSLGVVESVNLPKAPTFERMDNVVIDNDKIKQDSIESLESYKNSNNNNINENFDNKINDLNKSKVNLENSSKELKDSVKEDYSAIKEEVSNDAIKRGLAYSSIVINKLDAFNNKELDAYYQIDKELSNNLNAINLELGVLNSSKEEALNNFDIEYASKLNEQIAAATEKLKDAQAEVIKYNNQIAEKEAEYLKDVAELEQKLNDSNWEKEMDVAEMIAKYGSTVVDKIKQKKLLSAAQEFFAGMSKKDSAMILTTYPEIKQLLGEDNYNQIVKMFE